MRRVYPFLLLALALATVRGARAEPVDEARTRIEALRAEQAALVRPLLLGGEDRQIAWGATWARELSLTELVPELLQLLADGARDEEAVGYYGMLCVFDALLHLDAAGQVEPGVLRPFLERRHGFGADHRAAATTLALRAGNPHVLLDLFDVLDRDDQGWHPGWLALGNTLAGRRTPPGFAARVLAGIVIEVEITVREPGLLRGRGSSRTLIGGAGDGRLPQREGYPRMWRYELTTIPRAGRELLADGPTPVYLGRREALRGFGTVRSSIDRPEERIAWVAEMLRTEPEHLELKRRYGPVVPWTTPEDYLARVQVVEREIRAHFAETVQALLEAGHLASHETRGLEPVLEVSVCDDRDDRSVPLPPPPGQER